MPLKKIITIIAVNILLTVVLLECSLQAFYYFGKRFDFNKALPPIESSNSQRLSKISVTSLCRKAYQFLGSNESWEEKFLLSYTGVSDSMMMGLHKPHPTRGWALEPGKSITLQDKTYSTNKQGYRSLHDFEIEPEKYQVLIVGDSFTFGDDIDDHFTWPNLLSQKNTNLNVFNMGGSGYGTDQMLITLEEEINKYHPDLVIAAFIDNDLKRALIPFRDYKKPRFILKKNQLVMTNTPIGDQYQTMMEISQKRYFSYTPLLTMVLINNVISELTPSYSSANCVNECRELNTAIFERMQKISHDNQSDFLMVYLPNRWELLLDDYRSFGEDYFEDYERSHKGNFLNPRSGMLMSPVGRTKGHYQNDQSALLADFVMKKIETLPSWNQIK